MSASMTSSPAVADDLALARTLAAVADEISLPRFGSADLRVETKPDLTPVSDADLAVETALRDHLAVARPGDVVVGEEFSDDPVRHASSGRCWVIDPIDGTKNFVRGVPVWASLIALLVDGRPVVGAVSAPALARTWWGGDGAGAWTSFADGPAAPCAVSQVRELGDASLSISSLAGWAALGRQEEMLELSRSCWRTRGYGDFFSYMLLAQGAVDIATEPELSLWDLAALAPIVTAAGGTFTGVDGAPVGPGTASALATNGLLHQDVLAVLGTAT